jgi:glycosyltransferase involved in cell wall biosynthesis
MSRLTIVIPCYQERDFIQGCLQSVLAFELPLNSDAEIFVVDGMSTDGTRSIVESMCRQYPQIRMLDNPGRIQSKAMNLAIAAAQGEFIVRLDAHSTYPTDYVLQCVETAKRTGADNVGGLFITQARGSGYHASLVQALTTHPFGVGDAGFRVDASEGVADTVPYGCFRRDIFEQIGAYDERLVRAQDYEINRRITRMGGRVWLNPAIRVLYFQQPDLVSFYRKQIEKEAPYNAYLWYVAPYAFALRHAITAFFAAGVLGGILLSPFNSAVRWTFLAVMGLYATLAILSAVQQAVRYRRPLHILALPACFFLYHFLHGLGVLYGLFRLATGTAPVQRVREPWPGAGRLRAWPATPTAE